MIPRPWLLRAVERHLRAQGAAKSWATKQAGIRSAAELSAMLPLLKRTALWFRYARALLGQGIRRKLALRSGDQLRDAAGPMTATLDTVRRDAGTRKEGQPEGVRRRSKQT